MPPLNRYTIFCAMLLHCLPAFAQPQAIQFDDPYFSTPMLKPGQNPKATFANLVFLKVVPNKSTVFTGEALLVEYKLYRAVNTEPSPGRQPAFTGCGVVELPPVVIVESETINGRLYHVVLLRRVQLTPLRDGPLLLDSASVKNVVRFVTADKPSIEQAIDIEAISKPVTIDVKPLPEKNKPTDFTGVVGNFTVAIKADSNTVPVGENSHLTITVSGTGDIAAIAAPDIKWPANTEHFEPQATQRLVHDDYPSGGSKTFEIPFVASKQGAAIIPPVYVAFFNTQTQQYDSVHTDSLAIRFTPAQRATLHEIIEEDITNRKYLWIVPALALTVAFILIITGKTQRSEKTKQQQAAKAEKEPLPLELPPLEKTDFAKETAALADIEGDHVFYTQAKALLTQALRQKLDSFAFYEGDILQELQEKSHDSVLVETVQRIYGMCNQNLYSPLADTGQRATLQAALAEVIKQLAL